MKLWLDLETYSETPIKFGTYRYASDAEIMLFAHAVDDGPVKCYDLTTGNIPAKWVQYLLDKADEIWAHNSMFDRSVLEANGYHSPLPKWRDTMVKALAHSLPGGLDKLCEILKVPVDLAKHKDGKRLVQLFCKPAPANHKIRRATRETHPAEWQRFIDYAKADIDAMRAIDARMPTWNYPGTELALWHLDQQINDRGFGVDLELTRAAIDATAREQERLSVQANALTRGEVDRATKRDQMLEHILTEYGIALPDLQASTLERRLADPDIPDGMKELLRIRLQANTTSTSKYKAIANGVTDGRLRGTLQFDGAGRTGRWAGRTFQPQNLPRPALEAEDIEFGIEALKLDAADLIYANVMELTSSAIRGCIVAPPGKKLVVADLSNIEGRVLAWLAGEEWKLQAFRDFDAGEGPDLYKMAYAKSFAMEPEDVTKAQRQVGKVQELALGYEGGVGAFLTFSLAYGIDLDDMADEATPTLPGDVRKDAESFYDWTVKQRRSTYGLSRHAFVACDALKRMWREAHPATASLWRELKDACIGAIDSPGATIPVRALKVRKDGAWMRIGLPSGRSLCYPSPRVEDGALSYMGINQYSRKWSRIKTYGGKLVENVTQAVARDVLASSMPAIEAAGYEIVLTIHDEILTEAPDGPREWDGEIAPGQICYATYNDQELSALMTRVPTWAPGLPLAAAGFEGHRYRKD